MDSSNHKNIATEFLNMAGVEGNAHEAVQKFCVEGCKHHNPYFAEGMGFLATAMEENARQYSEKIYTVKHIIEEGDLVAVHGRVELQPGESWGATMHLFRFEHDRIAEMWDIAQLNPPNSLNKDGMF